MAHFPRSYIFAMLWLNPKSKKIYTACGVLLYAVWGLMSSAFVFKAHLVHSQILGAIIGIGVAGLWPLALHLYEVRAGKANFDWTTVLVSISLGGIVTLFLGTILQNFLLLCGIHSLLGLRIDTWFWQFPDWTDRY